MSEHTNHALKGKDLLGMSVFSIAEGKRLGEITTLLVRREDSTVAAVRIGSPLVRGVALAFGQLRVVGVDAVLVDSEASLSQSLPVEAVNALDDLVIGRAVLTASGDKVGTLSGFWVQTDTGRISAYRVQPEAGFLARLARLVQHDTLEVPIDHVQSLGANALIVADTLTAQAEAGSTESEAGPSEAGAERRT